MPRAGRLGACFGCRPATRLGMPLIAEVKIRIMLDPMRASSSEFLGKGRKNILREPLTAIKQSRNGSGGSAKVAQSLTAANTRRWITPIGKRLRALQ